MKFYSIITNYKHNTATSDFIKNTYNLKFWILS